MASPFENPNVNPFAPQQAAPQANAQYPGNPVPPNPSEQVPGQPSSQVSTQPDSQSGRDTQDTESQNRSLIDMMGEVWNNEVKDEPQLETVKPEHINTLSEKFQPVIDEEALAEAMQNQDPKKMAEIMASAARQAFAQGTEVSSKVSENYLNQERSQFSDRVTKKAMQDNIMSELGGLNPMITSSKPFKDFATDLVKKYVAKYPDSSPQEAAEKVNAYITQSATPTKKEEEEKKSNDDDIDWTDF